MFVQFVELNVELIMTCYGRLRCTYKDFLAIIKELTQNI